MTVEDDVRRFEKKLENDGAILQAEDGYWVYWPMAESGGGFLDEYGLWMLLDILKRRNAPLREETEQFFNRTMQPEV